MRVKVKNENIVYSTLLFIFLIAAILFFIIKVINAPFNQGEKYDMGNIEQYIQKEDESSIDETKIVKNYAMFNLVQEILQQFTDALINGDYKGTYGVLDSEMINKYKNKNDYINAVKEFTDNNFAIKDPDKLFVNKNKLKRVYMLSNTDFLAEYQVIDESTKKIGIRLDSKQQKYSIFYIEM